ncbi:MAG: thiamine ABC transporter substrate-binding protein [Anaerolineae bacterium]|nr:thiamine ABC transporter substrate-binding protein [Anaerolineae bacterium]
MLAAFEEESGLRVEILPLGDAGSLVNQAILSRANPLGDVLFGVDNTFLGRALENDLFEPYTSPALEAVPEELRLDPENRVAPIAFGDVCVNYDLEYLAENDLPAPDSLEALTDEVYRGLLVVQNPAASSPGLAFLMATVAAFGEEGDYTYLDYWADLRDNEVLVVDGWESAYYTEFTRYGGAYPLVISYASSPPAEIIFAEAPLDEAPTAALVAGGTCFRQIEFAGVLANAQNPEGAQQLIDFMLSEPFQTDLPLQMFVFPVLSEVELPEVFVEYAQVAESPATLPFEEINDQREEWIEAWTDVVLR